MRCGPSRQVRSWENPHVSFPPCCLSCSGGGLLWSLSRPMCFSGRVRGGAPKPHSAALVGCQWQGFLEFLEDWTEIRQKYYWRKGLLTCSPRASIIFEYHQCSVFLPVTHWYCASSLLAGVGAEFGMGVEVACLPGMLLAFIPRAFEGISTVLRCTVWSHRKGSEALAGVLCDTMAWSLSHDCCQTESSCLYHI